MDYSLISAVNNDSWMQWTERSHRFIIYIWATWWKPAINPEVSTCNVEQVNKTQDETWTWTCPQRFGSFQTSVRTDGGIEWFVSRRTLFIPQSKHTHEITFTGRLKICLWKFATMLFNLWYFQSLLLTRSHFHANHKHSLLVLKCLAANIKNLY